MLIVSSNRELQLGRPVVPVVGFGERSDAPRHHRITSSHSSSHHQSVQSATCQPENTQPRGPLNTQPDTLSRHSRLSTRSVHCNRRPTTTTGCCAAPANNQETTTADQPIDDQDDFRPVGHSQQSENKTTTASQGLAADRSCAERRDQPRQTVVRGVSSAPAA